MILDSRTLINKHIENQFRIEFFHLKIFRYVPKC